MQIKPEMSCGRRGTHGERNQAEMIFVVGFSCFQHRSVQDHQGLQEMLRKELIVFDFFKYSAVLLGHAVTLH